MLANPVTHIKENMFTSKDNEKIKRFFFYLKRQTRKAQFSFRNILLCIKQSIPEIAQIIHRSPSKKLLITPWVIKTLLLYKNFTIYRKINLHRTTLNSGVYWSTFMHTWKPSNLFEESNSFLLKMSASIARSQ